MPKDQEAENERQFRIVQGHAANLLEHFDTVQIFVTQHSEGSTTCVSYGQGNWFARYGQIREYVVKTDARAKREVKEEE